MNDDYEPHELPRKYPSSDDEGRERKKIPYFGKNVRGLFLTAAMIMLVFLPYVKQEINLPSFFLVVTILVVTFFAGFTNIKFWRIMLLDTIVSLIATAVFGYRAIENFARPLSLFEIINQTLAILFLISFYFAIRSLCFYFRSNK